MNRKQYLLFLAIPLGYFIFRVIQIFYFESSFINFESDNLIYDAKLVAEGLVPFRDLFTRSVIPLYLYAALISMFGVHVKLILILLALSATLSVLLIGTISWKLFHDYFVAIVAMLMIAIFGPGDLAELFLYSSLLIFIIASAKRKGPLFLLSGGLMALSVLSYRAYVVWILAIVMIIAFKFFNKKALHTLRELLIQQFYFLLGSGIVLLVTLLFYISITSWQWMSEAYLADKIIYSFVGSIVVGVCSLILFFIKKRNLLSIKWFYPIILLLSLGMFFYQPQPDPIIKIGVIHDFARLSLWLMIPFLFFITTNIIKLYGLNKIVRFTAWASFGLLVEIIIIGTYHVNRGPSLELDSYGKNYFITLTLLFCGIIFIYIAGSNSNKFLKLVKLKNVESDKKYFPTVSLFPYLIILFPALGVFLGSMTYSDWLPGHVYNYGFSLVMASAIFYVHLWRKKNIFAKSIVYCGIVVLIFTIFVFPKMTVDNSVYNSATEMRASDAWLAVEFIENNTDVGDEIFTAVPFFALRSGRNLMLNITHPVVYITEESDPMSYDLNNVVPAVSDIKEYLIRNKVEYLIQDERTRSLFRTDRHPGIAKYIRENYQSVQKFGDIQIFERITEFN